MNNPTVIIHTYNEEKNIRSCIESAKKLTSTIIVVDMQSSDKTVEISQKEGALVVSFPYSKYVEPAREFGIKQSKTDWVFLLDADERITDELAKEIKQTIHHSKSTHTYYKVPRKEFFAQKIWLRHGGLWPNYQTRFINKKYFVSWPKEIHSFPTIKGEVGYLHNPLLHFSKNDYGEIVNKTIIFEDIESDLLFKADKATSTFIFFRKFAGELYRRLLKNLGFLDGTIGIIESVYQAFSKTITYLYLYEKKYKLLSRTLRSLS